MACRLFRNYFSRRGRTNTIWQKEGSQKNNIVVVESHRPLVKTSRQRNHGCLIEVPRVNITKTSTPTEFAVPKCLFTNICGLAKSKHKVRAPVALEADLINNDIDACIVSETRLMMDVPDSTVKIRGYTLFRRDRGFSGLDKRKNGGVAIYQCKRKFESFEYFSFKSV